jgi:hypothetical protein
MKHFIRNILPDYVFDFDQFGTERAGEEFRLPFLPKRFKQTGFHSAIRVCNANAVVALALRAKSSARSYARAAV